MYGRMIIIDLSSMILSLYSVHCWSLGKKINEAYVDEKGHICQRTRQLVLMPLRVCQPS
jgi:hypothetical protein